MMTLEEVSGAFESWRANRVKRSRIPESLWSMVRELLPHYKKSLIIKALKMNSAQLESGCQKNHHHKITQNGFAIGYVNQYAHGILQQEQRCELTLKGASKSLHINIDITQLTHVLPLVERCL